VALLLATDQEGLKEFTRQLIESDPEMQEQIKKYQEAMERADRYDRTRH
jgi:hypothetical protein